MAENKKSFVAYADWENQLDLLSDDEAGKLFRHLLAYVNDRNPEFSHEDRILKMAFEPIRLQLKRDLEKYEEVKQKRSQAGRSGGLKSGEARSKVNQIETNEANASFDTKNEANEAVNDNVTVNVNDTVNVILLEKETKEEKLIKENSQELFSDSETVGNDTEKRKKVAQKKEKQEPPDLDTFIAHAKEIYQNELKMDFSLYEFAVKAKYQSWIDAGWKDGHKKPIQAWKNKLRNLIPYLKPIYGNHNNSNNGFTKTTVAGSNATSGKTSATTAIARQLAKISASNSESGDFTTDA
ncbi:DUF6291 domain-containing protein [Chryseobacterium sp. 8AT]|uniref:DUF6291 domain-containing protein n=1 Tax=Chryseobacterium sp. 8AT TaxID=2653134 RepID=UPI0012F28E41|nr:DUF6291 domain-containing protein [Chryseobacterium sp. 8AT]VXB04122.1 conserved hypothetical protein [Chryseobacterium sp. 8AT]